MPKRILIVDDEPDILRVVIFRLKKSGYEVLTAIDGQAALDLIQKEPLDLIILDLRLPIIGGLEVCKQIKSNDKFKHIPVILFTASTGSIKEKAAEACANDYLIKPFEPEVFLQKIKTFIG